MPLLKKKASFTRKTGLPPGSLVYTGYRKPGKIRKSIIRYDAEGHFATEHIKTANLFSSMAPGVVNWINIEGLEDTAIIEEIGNHFKIDSLLLEDILNTDHLPKFEETPKHLFFTLKMLTLQADNGEIESEHLSLLLGNDYVLSFQEKEGDIFDALRERLINSDSKARQKKADYLFFRLIDIVIDNYYFILEHLRDRIDNVEDELMDKTDEYILTEIINLKKKFTMIRKILYPLRDAIYSLCSSHHKMINSETYPFLNDLKDHLNHIRETFEQFREHTTSLMELYNANNANQMNRIMQRLTVVASIFIPLTFLAGIYGMNFANMPELHWKYGYPAALGLMVVIGIIFLIYMKRKRWF